MERGWYLKVVFPLFFRLTAKIHIIPLRSFLERFLGWTRFILVGRITKNQYSKWLIHTWRKIASSVVYDNIKTLYFHFMFGWSSIRDLLEIQREKIEGIKGVREWRKFFCLNEGKVIYSRWAIDDPLID